MCEEVDNPSEGNGGVFEDFAGKDFKIVAAEVFDKVSAEDFE